MTRPPVIDYDEPPLSEWSDWLAAAIDLAHLKLISWPVVIAETASTQDAARRLAGTTAGVLVLAGRQTAGRGRLGRRWADTADKGVAMSLALRLPAHHRALLPLAAGVAVAEALAHTVTATGNPYSLDNAEIAIRWPNDIVTIPAHSHSTLARAAAESRMATAFALHEDRGGPSAGPTQSFLAVSQLPASLLTERKLAGILIEQHDDLTILGVGVNVAHTQADWPEDLRARAVSTRQLGADRSRPEVAERIMIELDRWIGAPPDRLRARFAQLDCLQGTRRRFTHNGRTYEGTVKALAPDASIDVTLDSGETISLPAATTSLIHE